MSFYENGLVPEEIQPEWDVWGKIPALPLERLVGLALNLDPLKPYKDYFEKLIKKEEDLECRPYNRANLYFDYDHEPLELYEVYCLREESNLSDKDKHDIKVSDSLINGYKTAQESLDKSSINLYDIAYSHLEHGILRPPINIISMEGTFRGSLTDSYASSLYISDFVDWLESQSIPYPEKMKNCMVMREKPEEPKELTAGEKSKLSQENTTLWQWCNCLYY